MANISNPVVVGIVVVAIIVVVALAWSFSRRRRSEELRERFGPEYDHTVQQYGEQGHAEAVLQARKDRVDRLDIRPLTPEESSRFSQSWHSIEAQFVDDPAGAVAAADSLCTEVMKARGYPDTDFEQRMSDISATYPDLVEDYRTTHEIVAGSRGGSVSTEDLRKAIQSYKALFGRLLDTRDRERREAA